MLHCVLVEVTKQPTCLKGACCTNDHVGVGVHTCRLLSNFNQSSCNTETLLLRKNVHHWTTRSVFLFFFFTCSIIQVMWPLANMVRVYCSVYCPATAPSTAQSTAPSTAPSTAQSTAPSTAQSTAPSTAPSTAQSTAPSTAKLLLLLTHKPSLFLSLSPPLPLTLLYRYNVATAASNSAKTVLFYSRECHAKLYRPSGTLYVTLALFTVQVSVCGWSSGKPAERKPGRPRPVSAGPELTSSPFSSLNTPTHSG